MCVASQNLKSIRLYLLEIRYDVKEEAVWKADGAECLSGSHWGSI